MWYRVKIDEDRFFVDEATLAGMKADGKKFKIETSYADEDLECAIEDLAWWIKENLDGTPLIFRNLKLQEQLYKQVEEFRSE